MACVQMRPIAVDGLKWPASASVNNGYDRVPCKATGKTGAKKRRVVDGARIPFGKGGWRGTFERRQVSCPAVGVLIVTLSDSFEFIGAI